MPGPCTTAIILAGMVCAAAKRDKIMLNPCPCLTALFILASMECAAVEDAGSLARRNG